MTEVIGAPAIITDPVEEQQTLTHSRMQCFKTCPRMHFYAYEMLLRPIRTSEPLTEGGAFHLAQETYDLTPGSHDEKKQAGRRIVMQRYATVPPWCVTDDEIHSWQCQGAKMASMFELHCDFWRLSGLNIVATEQAYNLPLRNPDGGGVSRNFRLAGKIDRIAMLTGDRLAVQEYKTTSSDIGPEADYWKRLRIDSQISGYVLAARGLGHAVETVLYDVTRKPALRPGKATPPESRKYTKDGALYAKQREYNESPQEYATRIVTAIVEDCNTATAEGRPNRYFRREEIARLESDLREHQYDVWGVQKAIRECQRSGTWPRNTGACFGHFGKCPYFGPCTSGDHELVLAGVIPEGFRRAETMHEELADTNTD